MMIKPRLILCDDIPCVYVGEYGSQNPDVYGSATHSLTGLALALKKGKYKDLLIERRILTIAGSSIRKMIHCCIRLDNKLIDALADIVTGTVYDPESGLCYSSDQLRLCLNE